jgi:cysteinyl-tRNA synthetase
MLRLYNTLSREKEIFMPLTEQRVGIYTCGPTVYNYAHIGNFRTYIFEDILRRYLKYKGFDVFQVMNITDIEDKIIRDAKAAGVSIAEFTAGYTASFFEDLDSLNIERAEEYPRATDCVDDMVQIIELLLERGHAYRSEGGIYFRISSFPEYGRLSGVDPAGIMAGARVASDEYEKEDVRDFALWKDRKEGEPCWSTSLGDGRPGWHIECSAMSMRYLGAHFDIHTGGVDNIFPHHENEIAQSVGATGERFVNYWLHSEHLIVDGEKMSKSKGNFYTLRDLTGRGFSPVAIRYLLLSVHYRKQLNFTLEGISHAGQAIGRLRDFLERMRGSAYPAGDDRELSAAADRGREGFEAALNDDLNTAGALGALFQMVREGNAAADEGRMRQTNADRFAAEARRLDRILGVLEPAVAEQDSSLDSGLRRLVLERAAARAAKDFAKADIIRQELLDAGYELEDVRREDGSMGTKVYSVGHPRLLVWTT